MSEHTAESLSGTPASATVPSPSPSRSIRSLTTTQPVWRVGVLAAVAGALVTEVFSLGARGLGIPMKAASPGAASAQPIPPMGFAFGVLFYSVVGIVLAVCLARWAKRPARTFAVTTVTLTVLSFVPPVLAPHTATSTQVLLCLSHIVAAAVIIPVLTGRLKHAESRPAA